ncbi:hypothetical protein FXO38_32252 [Capsicum annuum]|nr:hypothetical protein FXO38_32252 [Capsicum annuum]
MVYSEVSLSNMKLAAAKVKIPSKEELSPCLSSTDELVGLSSTDELVERWCILGSLVSAIILASTNFPNGCIKSKFLEQQVSIILYGDDIPKYENLFGLFEAYLVSCAKVREPRNYLIRPAMYEWVVDRYTIVEAVTNNNGSEVPLLAPTKLDTLSFSAIEEQRPGVEFALRLATRYQLTILTNPQYVQATALTNWCYFKVNIIDASDTITVMISETLGERMLSLTSVQIYELVAVQLTTTTFWWPLPALSHGMVCTEKFCLALPASQSQAA